MKSRVETSSPYPHQMALMEVSAFFCLFHSLPRLRTKTFCLRSVLFYRFILSRFYPGSLFYRLRFWRTKWFHNSLFRLGDYRDLARHLRSLSTTRLFYCAPLHAHDYTFGVSRSRLARVVSTTSTTGSNRCVPPPETTAFPFRDPLPPALELLWYVLYKSRALPCSAG